MQSPLSSHMGTPKIASLPSAGRGKEFTESITIKRLPGFSSFLSERTLCLAYLTNIVNFTLGWKQ